VHHERSSCLRLVEEYLYLARSLYGGRRLFYDSSIETGKEGFSHMISGTVSDFNNETLIKLEERYGDDIRLLHNAHDGDKVAMKKSKITKDYGLGNMQVKVNFIKDIREIIERPITYQDRTLTLTAGIKVYG